MFAGTEMTTLRSYSWCVRLLVGSIKKAAHSFGQDRADVYSLFETDPDNGAPKAQDGVLILQLVPSMNNCSTSSSQLILGQSSYDPSFSLHQTIPLSVLLEASCPYGRSTADRDWSTSVWRPISHHVCYGKHERTTSRKGQVPRLD